MEPTLDAVMEVVNVILTECPALNFVGLMTIGDPDAGAKDFVVRLVWCGGVRRLS